MTYSYIGTFTRFIVAEDAIPSEINIGVVMGGGVQDGQPRPLLKDRLDTAKRMIESGVLDVLLLSGDNRTAAYDEPTVMRDYLVSNGINGDLLQTDFAGRSTYETCERANKIFGLKQAVFISESTHLPRVLYLCRHFGIESYGVASDGISSSGLRIGQRWREVLARNKALLNVYIKGEDTVLGEQILLPKR